MDIILENISKKYNGNYILKDINLDIKSGIYGLLGHNGAGKTTLIKILLGLILPDSGKVIYKNDYQTIKYIQNFIGYSPQSLGLDNSLTVEEYLKYIGLYKNIKKSVVMDNMYKFAELFSYTDFLKTKIKKLSGGTKQKIKLTQAFLNSPKIVILDEPSVGLDIDERRNLKNFLSKYGMKNTIVVSTHIISDIDQIVKNIIILKNGEVCAEGTFENLSKMIPGNVYEVIALNEDIEEIIKNHDIIQLNSVYNENGTRKLRFISDRNEVTDAKIVKKDLEDVYEYFQGRVVL